MIFHRHVPAPPLNSFIEFLWLYEDYRPLHTKEKLLPDGTMELIIDLRDHPKHKYDPRDFSRATPYRRAWLSGMQPEYLVIESSPGSMMGAHFRPGGAWPFFGAPLSEFAEQVIELDCVIGTRATSLRDHLLEIPTVKGKFAVLEAALLRFGGDAIYPDRRLHSAVDQLISSDVKLLIRDLAAKVGVSQKHLIDLFQERVGMRPKQLDRVIRFQKVIKALAKAKPLMIDPTLMAVDEGYYDRVHAQSAAARDVDWAAIAMDCGYYDQAHFIHDFQAFSGMTPTAYAAQHWDYSNYVIVDPPKKVPPERPT